MKRFGRDERGNVVVIFSIAAPVVMAMAAGAISYSQGLAIRNDMQVAVDSAVLAGAIVLGSGDPIAAAQKVFFANLKQTKSGGTTEITANFTVKDATVYGTVAGQASNPFSGLIGTPTYTVRATGAATAHSTPVCVLGLNAYDKGSFDINGNPSFNAACAVQANSGSTTGMTQEGNASVRAARFGVAGGHKTNNFTPTPVEGGAKVADPYASLPFPDHAPCAQGARGLTIKSSQDLLKWTPRAGPLIAGLKV